MQLVNVLIVPSILALCILAAARIHQAVRKDW